MSEASVPRTKMAVGRNKPEVCSLSYLSQIWDHSRLGSAVMVDQSTLHVAWLSFKHGMAAQGDRFPSLNGMSKNL